MAAGRKGEDTTDDSVIALLHPLWRGARLPSVPPASPAEWDAFCETVARHGLMGLLYAFQPPDSLLPDKALLALKHHYRSIFLANVLALEQLAAIVRAFNRHGVPVIVLKGCAALLFLYRRIAWREIGDIDLLIQEQHVPAARRIMIELGYVSSHDSPAEDEYRNFLSGHLDPFCKEGHLPVEFHGSIVYGRGRDREAAGEVWEHSLVTSYRGTPVRTLCPSHFLIHAAVHSIKHLQQFTFSLKNMGDVILISREFGGAMDWPAFWQTAQRWGVRHEVTVILATANRHWGIGIPIPGPFSGGIARAIQVHILVSGAGLSQPWHRVLVRYARALSRAKELPNLNDRIRYCFHLVFPVSGILRQRYGVRHPKWLLPYYFLHIFHKFRNLVSN